jgi:hypothetical protein
LFAPELALRSGAWQVALNGAGGANGSTAWLREAHGQIVAPLFGGARFTLQQDVMRSTTAPGSWTFTDVGLQLHRTVDHLDLSIGGGVVRYGAPGRINVAPSIGTEIRLDSRWLTLTGSARFDAVTGFDSSTVHSSDTLGVASYRGSLSLAADVNLSFQASLGPVQADGSLGAFVARGTRPFASLSVSHWIAPGVAITAGASHRVLDPLRGASANDLRVGLRLGTLSRARRAPGGAQNDMPLPAAIQAQRAGDSVTIVLPATRAERIELRGDFSEWSTRALVRSADGSWRVTVRLPAGVYRFDVRTDGGNWTAPDGVAHVTDPYVGEVGLLVVQ